MDIGFPAEEKREIFTDWQDRPSGCAVCMDIIKEGMIAVLFAECTPNWQGVTNTPVNRRVIENDVDAYEKELEELLKEDVQWIQEPFWKYREYAEQYFAFLDGAEFPKAPYSVHIWDIVEEEAEAYFAGTKSAEEVAKVIDNRVQLYLDERK